MEAELLIRWYVCDYFVALLPLFTVQVLLRIMLENKKMQEATYLVSLNWQRNGVIKGSWYYGLLFIIAF